MGGFGLVFQHGVSMCSPSHPRTCFVDPPGPGLERSQCLCFPSAGGLMGLKSCTTTLSMFFLMHVHNVF